MEFIPRLTRPEAGNKYYIRKASGGYSNAVKGSPTDPACDVLHNCVGYAYGRFNEIGGWGSCKYLSPVNAENFIKYKGALEVGQEPRLGACMVWQAGPTQNGSDGAGHVAIVEKIINATEIITSESGWGAANPFWTQTRKKGSDGNWGQGANYTFLGFIYNPAECCKGTTLVSIQSYTKIMGAAVATAAQMQAYIKSINPSVPQSVITMIPFYLSEGAAEGVRGDIAFAQSCLETGNFKFAGSAVTLDQNNFCGMGVTSNGMKGNSFNSPQLGIRAQIQHLKAYASTDALKNALIDPRFNYVTRGCAEYVEWLGQQENPNGKGWAAGAEYGKNILRILNSITNLEVKEEKTTGGGNNSMKYNENNKPLVCMQTQSTCYKGTSTMQVKGVLWHSTGANNPTLKRYVQPSDNAADRAEMLKILGTNPNKNDWNHIYREAGLNCWIGKLADGTVTTVQTMPWNYRPWGCGGGSKGSCNDGWIQFEICEDGLTDPVYFNAVYKEACEITAYLCKLYNIDPLGTVTVNGTKIPTILCHWDSYTLGFGCGHSDVTHWFPKFGKSMETARNDVAALLAGSKSDEEEEDMTDERFNELMNNWLVKKAAEKETWGTENLEWAKEKGLMQGDEAGRLMPNKFCTRLEMVTMLKRLAEKLGLK